MFDLDRTVGVEEITKRNLELSISPNPCLNSCTINYRSSQKLPEVKLRFEVVDLNGQTILQSNLSESNSNLYLAKLDLTKYPSGMYFIKIFNSCCVSASKFIKQ